MNEGKFKRLLKRENSGPTVVNIIEKFIEENSKLISANKNTLFSKIKRVLIKRK